MRDTLEAAYRAALYRISAPAGRILLRVDERSVELADLLRSAGANEASLLTAFNPRSEVQPAGWNHNTQQRLMAELTELGYPLLPGWNVDPAGQWPPEESVLALGMALPAARDCATRYQQVAFLWMDATAATPRLIDTGIPS